MSVISLACAHPAKFPEIINKSINITPEIPFHLENIMSSKEHFDIIEPSINEVQNFIKSNMRN
jgi:threonine synthase